MKSPRRAFLAFLCAALVFAASALVWRRHAMMPPAASPAGNGFPLVVAPARNKINPKDGAEMVYVPAGPFLMGDDDQQFDNPRHTVMLSGYYIYKNDVTVAMYRNFCMATNRQKGLEMMADPIYDWKDDHPIVRVTWYDAKAYCDWAGVHLPTEAQWEKAARGTDGRTYPWGNDFDTSRLCQNASGTAPVGSFPKGASPYGALDMAGNVWQWCADWYDIDYWKTKREANPKGEASGRYRVYRGGWWGYRGDDGFHAARRDRTNPADSDDWNGFRGASGP